MTETRQVPCKLCGQPIMNTKPVLVTIWSHPKRIQSLVLIGSKRRTFKEAQELFGTKTRLLKGKESQWTEQQLNNAEYDGAWE